jgi:hypothetical protein
LEEISRVITLTAFAITLFALLAAPLLALQWRQRPFPGMFLDPYLLVNNRESPGWSGKEIGIPTSAKVIRIAGQPVFDHADYNPVIENQEVGTAVPVFIRRQDGTVELFPQVELTRFSNSDFFIQFWLPYLLGLAYFIIALWVYSTSGDTRPGRALAFFCTAVALSTGLLFDILTSHLSDELWTMAFCALGGALISLALRFPIEWRPVRRHPWLLAIPYLISISLGVWGVWALQQANNPWLFLQTRQAAYRYTTVGVLLFLAMTAVRARSSARASVRRQARLVLFGSLLAFAPIVTWFTAPLLGLTFQFNSTLLLPGLLLFPLTVAVAILRYRLLEIDTLVNRAIVYGILTAALAGVIAATTGISQTLFIELTGERSDFAIILTTLLVVAATTPIKDRIQSWVDRQYREMPALELRRFGQEVENHIRMTDPDLLGKHLVEQAASNLRAQAAALFFDDESELSLKHTYGEWRGSAEVSVPILVDGQRIGLLKLAGRRNGRPYKRYEVESLNRVAQQVGRLMSTYHA